MNSIDKKLEELNIQLPEAAAPVANYVGYQVIDNMVYISGQIPLIDGKLHFPGSVPEDVTIEDAHQAARLCGINILAQLKAACNGDLEKVERCVKLGGFVQSQRGFTDHPKVINGASNLMVEVFGEAGKHTRFAVGAPSLPLNTSVEIDAIFQLKKS